VGDEEGRNTGPEENRMEFTPVPQRPGILTEEQAYDAARWHMMRGYYPAARASAQLGELTDHDWYEEDPSGERRYMCKGRLVWLVTFSGVEIYSASGDKPSVYRERHVVIDATSGERLMEFSVR
jgi:hypothetical protein